MNADLLNYQAHVIKSVLLGVLQCFDIKLVTLAEEHHNNNISLFKNPKLLFFIAS